MPPKNRGGNIMKANRYRISFVATAAKQDKTKATSFYTKMSKKGKKRKK